MLTSCPNILKSNCEQKVQKCGGPRVFVEKTEAHCHAHLFQKLASTVVAKLIGHWLICLKLCSKLDMENVQVSEHMRFTVPIVGSCNCF